MNSKIARINSEIERRTAEIINNKLSDPRLKGGLISVTSARTTSDLKSAMDIRNMPELTFILDTSIEYGMKIDKLLKEIHDKEQND